jgi:hypothetical protein
LVAQDFARVRGLAKERGRESEDRVRLRVGARERRRLVKERERERVKESSPQMDASEGCLLARA